jgi:hypothetical protein
MSPRTSQTDLDRQIATTHRRFVKAMEERMPSLADDTKAVYFAILSKLVDKLETGDKPLKEILQEMMGEAMGDVLQLIQG